MSGGAVAEIVRSNYENVYRHKSAAKVRGQMANQYGFNTNVQTKPEVIGNLKRALLDRFNAGVGVTIHSRVLYGEMAGCIRTDTGEYKNSASDEESEHDDTVMAFGLAITATVHEADSADRPHIIPERPRQATDLPPETRRVAAEVQATIAPKVEREDGSLRMQLQRNRDNRAYTEDDEYLAYMDGGGDPFSLYNDDPW